MPRAVTWRAGSRDAGLQGCSGTRQQGMPAKGDAALDGQGPGCLPLLPLSQTPLPSMGTGPAMGAGLRARSPLGADAALPVTLCRGLTRCGAKQESACCLLFTCLGVMVPPKINPPSFTRPSHGGTWAGSERGAEPKVGGGEGGQNKRWGRGPGLRPGGVMLLMAGGEPKGCIPQPHLPPSPPVGVPLARGTFYRSSLAISHRFKSQARLEGLAWPVPALHYPFPSGGLDEPGLILIGYDLLSKLKLLLPTFPLPSHQPPPCLSCGREAELPLSVCLSVPPAIAEALFLPGVRPPLALEGIGSFSGLPGPSTVSPGGWGLNATSWPYRGALLSPAAPGMAWSSILAAIIVVIIIIKIIMTTIMITTTSFPARSPAFSWMTHTPLHAKANTVNQLCWDLEQ